MIKKSFSISYPAIYNGTDKSKISFITGTPDLLSLFYKKENTECEDEISETDEELVDNSVEENISSSDTCDNFSENDDIDFELDETLNESASDSLESDTVIPIKQKEEKFVSKNVKAHQKRFFVTDATVASLECMTPFISKFDDGVFGDDNLLILGSGEKYKTVESVLRIVTSAIEAGLSRKDIFIGIGGGVICDTTAFAASIFKRGASVQLVPTTLLAMVDASIGGKTGCDYQNYKNIIGTFYPASKIFYFPEFIQYLPEHQYNSGLAEAFKTGLLCDKELYDMFKDKSDKILERDSKLIEEMIKRCVSAKAKIVEEDFTEQNIRANLNLGHTFGHALETVAGLGTITHGSAVAWGISRSIELSFNKGLCKEAFRNEVFDILEKYNWETCPEPSCIIGGGVGDRLASVMHKDKKNVSGKIRVVLQKDICDTVIKEVDDEDILGVLK